MNALKRIVWRTAVAGVRLYQRTVMRVEVRGREHIPPGPKLYVANHITAFDPLYLLPVFSEPVHIILGPPYRFAVCRWVFDAFEQINAMPQHRAAVVDRAARYLRRGESVVMFPEGDLQDQPELGRFYPGAARIHRATGAPIVPIALAAPPDCLREYPFPTVVDGRVYRCVVTLRGPYLVNVGRPMAPMAGHGEGADEQDEAITHAVRQRMIHLCEELRQRHGTSR